MTTRIAVIKGDGIGPEVIETALSALPSDYEPFKVDAGADRYLATGTTLTDNQIAMIAQSDAVLLGAVGDPRVPDGVLERGILLRLRQELDLYVNLRPFPETGVVFVRENTEGPYVGVGRTKADTATEFSVNTRGAIKRCAEYAFNIARDRTGHVTLVHKTNVLRYAGGMWRDVVQEVGLDHPDVELRYEHADAAAYHLVREPSRFDVILTDNLFGDVLSDVAAAVSGGLGRAASANLHPDPATRPSRCVGLFEPVHGSAPDIAGRGIADPTAALRAAQMMVEEIEKERVTT